MEEAAEEVEEEEEEEKEEGKKNAPIHYHHMEGEGHTPWHLAGDGASPLRS